MKSIILFYFLLFQNIEMADRLRSDGKIYIVVIVFMIILIALFIYLYRIERKIDHLNKK